MFLSCRGHLEAIKFEVKKSPQFTPPPPPPAFGGKLEFSDHMFVQVAST